jgi:probable rRNA maturation factor
MREVRVTDPGALAPCGVTDVERWATTVLEGERVEAGALSITFLTGAEMRALNHRALGRDRPTDVLAFRLDDPQGLVGDVYVCPSVASANAKQAHVPVEQEVLRLVVHGMLHVLGHDHPEGGRARATSPMWARQEAYVQRLWDGVVA